MKINLKSLAENAGPQNRSVLVLFGDKAINLLGTEDISRKAQFEVIGNWSRTQVKEIADALKDLIH